MFNFAAKFAEGLEYQEFLARFANEEQRTRWQVVFDAVALTSAQQELLKSFVREIKILCLTGAWCGDCVRQCPIFAQFVAQQPRLNVRYFDRDAHPDLAAELAICGGARVPVMVFLSEDGALLSWYGDRTLTKYRQLASQLTGPACPTGIGKVDTELLAGVTQDWLNELERVQWMARTSSRLRQLHGD